MFDGYQVTMWTFERENGILKGCYFGKNISLYRRMPNPYLNHSNNPSLNLYSHPNSFFGKGKVKLNVVIEPDSN